jgi:hypothetical protein
MRKKCDLGGLRVTRGELAEFLGLSPRHVSRLAAEGVIPAPTGNGYLLRECVRGYVGAGRRRTGYDWEALDIEAIEAALIGDPRFC